MIRIQYNTVEGVMDFRKEKRQAPTQILEEYKEASYLNNGDTQRAYNARLAPEIGVSIAGLYAAIDQSQCTSVRKRYLAGIICEWLQCAIDRNVPVIPITVEALRTQVASKTEQTPTMAMLGFVTPLHASGINNPCPLCVESDLG